MSTMTIKTKLRTFYILYLFLIHLPGAHSQSTSPDPALVSSLGNNYRLYTGAEYVRNGLKANGHAFFQSDSTLAGSLFYDGATYDNIPLQYDLVTDEVFIYDNINNVSISLVKDKLPRFTIGGHTFVTIKADSTTNISSKKFYELLNDAPYALYGRYDKKLVFPTNREDALKYTSSQAYYLKLKDQYIRIDGQRSLLRALDDKRDELKKFIRQNDPDFKHNPGNAYAMVIHYYTQLKH